MRIAIYPYPVSFPYNFFKKLDIRFVGFIISFMCVFINYMNWVAAHPQHNLWVIELPSECLVVDPRDVYEVV
jgi:hypothetical protein